jgi:5,10-methylene-tetrahydrofolate dehydrogenase/methenyl tetrahydrofolate cyclohydrolase
MSATVIDGKRAARDIRDGLRQRILALSAIGVRPRLAIVMVGNASAQSRDATVRRPLVTST